jgi:hypothetical protein
VGIFDLAASLGKTFVRFESQSMAFMLANLEIQGTFDVPVSVFLGRTL